MTTNPISLTETYLFPKIYEMANVHEKNLQGFCKRELLSRILATTIFLFRASDFCANLSMSMIFYLSHKLDLTRHNSTSTKSLQTAKIYFHGAKHAITPNFPQTWKLISSPGIYRENIFRAAKLTNVDVLLKIDRPKIASERLAKLGDEVDHNWGLKDYFGHIYIINLDDRDNSKKYAERLENVQADLKKVGVMPEDCERFRAIHGATELNEKIWSKIDDNSFNKQGIELENVHKAQAGNFMSHYNIIKDAHTKYKTAKKQFNLLKKEYFQTSSLNRKNEIWTEIIKSADQMKEYSSILIIEDDNGFGFLKENQTETSLQGAGQSFQHVMQELPENWHMFYFMADHGYAWNIQHHSTHLNRMTYGVCLNAYAVNHLAYKSIKNALSKIHEPNAKVRPTDHVIASLHASHNVFLPKAPLAYQHCGQSSISGEEGNRFWNGEEERGY
jgi:hypothetical protein